jgi:formylmethanofuran dehydrogenase subunit E
MKYRKKTVVIEAEKWDGNFLEDILRYTDSETRECEHCGEMLYLHGWINTLEGGHIVCPGDWIISRIEVKICLHMNK